MPLNLTASCVPWARYKVQTDKLAFNLGGQTGEVEFKGLQLAADPENSIPGWLRVDENSRDFVAAKLNQPPPKAPGDKYVWTAALLIYSPKVMGDTVFQLCDTSFSYRRFVEQLFNRCEPEFGKDAVPLIKIVDTLTVPMGNGSTTQILFEIEKWIARPDCFLEAIKLRDSAAAAAAAAKPDHPPGNAYAVATGAEMPETGRRDFGQDLDDSIPFAPEWR